MIAAGLGIALILGAWWLHRARRSPRPGRPYWLAWTDPAGWSPLVTLLYLAGVGLVAVGVLRGVL